MEHTYGYWEFYKVEGWLELYESVNSQTVKGLIKELTYEDSELTIWIEWTRIITLSGKSVQSLKMYFYGFLRWMEEMGVVIRDTFNL